MAKTYAFKRVVATVAARPITGFAEDQAITIEYDADTWSKTEGCDGEVTRVHQNRKGGKITFFLAASSDLNAYFDGLQKADDVSLFGQVPIVIVDVLGGTRFMCPQGWIMKDPGHTFNRELGVKEWVFDCDEIISSHAGNV